MHALAAFACIVWTLVFIQTIANLLAVPRLSGGSSPNARPFVSIVIPARNEARVIEQTVRAFLAQDYGNFEVIVVNDRSTDATGEVLRAVSDPRLTVVESEETPAGWLGKPWALEEGRRRARGEVLLFVDADLIYQPAAVSAAVAEFERTGAAMLSLFPRFEMQGFVEHMAMPMIAWFGFCVAPLWWSNRSNTPRLAMGGGSGNMIRGDVLQSMGGFEPLRQAVVDDIGLARLARRHGAITRTARADDLIAVRMYHSGGEIVEGFTKNLFAGLDRSFLLGGTFGALYVILNLAPYAIALTGDLFAIAAVILISLSRAVLFTSLGYRLDNAILLHPVMTAFWAYIFLRSIWFTGVRNELRWRGRTYDAAQTRFGAER